MQGSGGTVYPVLTYRRDRPLPLTSLRSHITQTFRLVRHQHRRTDRRPRGQSLVELAVILPLLLVLTGGIIQIGTVIATKHTLIQIGRDVGRWAATQSVDPCQNLMLDGQPARRADEIAIESRLMGYTAGTWPANFRLMGGGPPTTPGVEIAWEVDSGSCPPENSSTAAFVTIRLAHQAPVLVPGLDLGLAILPGLGSDGVLLVTTTAQFRMEPQAEVVESAP
jgi:hypothetical protein